MLRNDMRSVVGDLLVRKLALVQVVEVRVIYCSFSADSLSWLVLQHSLKNRHYSSILPRTRYITILHNLELAKSWDFEINCD